uniref:Winged helix-like DNA-binding domain superfamily protein n=1 Tax=Clostridioides difficile TaxID=1496 RepID=A0A5E4DPU9_CLODI|nr:MarR family transcriptional regulator [Clostridioides difficile]VUB78604.1 Winged helix-like DNA-binding domain superfamily protein [Clostridioides difficile]
MGKNVVNFSEAERKARLRDLENEKILSDEEMAIAQELQAKANARGMKLVPDKKIKNNTHFVQIIQQNFRYLREQNYLTLAEKGFLLDISEFVGFLSNCIVDDITKKSPVPLNQSDLAKALGRGRNKISPLVNSLVDKGIMARAESGLEDNNARAYALYINPNIMFSGSKDDVNETLKTMFKKAMRNPVLKKLPIKLF